MFFRSAQAADCIKIELGILLAIPTTTRQNSFYDAVCQLKTCFKNHEKCAALDLLCNTLNLPAFSHGKFMISMLCLDTFFNCKIFIVFEGWRAAFIES